MCSISTSKYNKIEIKFHCLTSRFIFEKLKKNKTVFIFASGTISGWEFKDTGLPMYHNFTPKYPEENPYPNNNVKTFYVEKSGNQGVVLNIDTKNPDYVEVLKYLKAVIPEIPNGVLVFFKSSTYLDKIK